MKFAWRGETSAPPIRWPFARQSSSILPAPSSPGAFLKTEPNVRLFVGCVALRCATSSATRALISPAGRGASAYSTSATTCPGAASWSAGIRARARRRSASRSLGRDDERPRGSSPSPIRTHPRSSARPHRRCPESRTRTRARRARPHERGGGRRRSRRPLPRAAPRRPPPPERAHPRGARRERRRPHRARGRSSPDRSRRPPGRALRPRRRFSRARRPSSAWRTLGPSHPCRWSSRRSA